MKNMDITKKRIIYYFSLLIYSVGLTSCNNSEKDTLKSTNIINSYDLSAYTDVSFTEWAELMDYVEVDTIDEQIIGYDGGLVIYYENGKIKEIELTDAYKAEEYPWTLCGLKPGMKMEDVLKRLDMPGIVVESHNLQFYASGIQLEDKGIKLLTWDADQYITYVNAVMDTSNMNILAGGEFCINEATMSQYNEKQDVSIQIHYPVIEMKNDLQTAENINHNIETVVEKIMLDIDVSDMQNNIINVNYIIKNIECECFSILWSGIYQDESGKKEINTAMTCSFVDNGTLHQVTDMGLSEELIVSEMSWRLDIDATVLSKQLQDNYYNFYVTPLYLVIIYKDSATGENVNVSIMK